MLVVGHEGSAPKRLLRLNANQDSCRFNSGMLSHVRVCSFQDTGSNPASSTASHAPSSPPPSRLRHCC